MSLTFQKTKVVRDALSLAEQVRDCNQQAIGEITGGTGTGKTAAGFALVETLGAVRVACYHNMTQAQLLRAIAKGAGVEGSTRYFLDALMNTEKTRRVLVVDEANKLKWAGLELLRYLSDECHWAVILVGTELYSQQFTAARTKALLLQLGRRIGAKRLKLKALDKADTYVNIFKPAFGEAKQLVPLAEQFWKGCRKGNWGEGVELRDECLRLMKIDGAATLNKAILDTAILWMANSRD